MFPGLQWTLAVYKVAGTMPSKQKTKAIVCCASRLCTPGGGNVSMRRMVVRRADILLRMVVRRPDIFCRQLLIINDAANDVTERGR